MRGSVSTFCGRTYVSIYSYLPTYLPSPLRHLFSFTFESNFNIDHLYQGVGFSSIIDFYICRDLTFDSLIHQTCIFSVSSINNLNTYQHRNEIKDDGAHQTGHVAIFFIWFFQAKIMNLSSPWWDADVSFHLYCLSVSLTLDVDLSNRYVMRRIVFFRKWREAWFPHKITLR